MSPPRLSSSACVIVIGFSCGSCAGPGQGAGASGKSGDAPATQSTVTVADDLPHAEPVIPLDGTPWIIDMTPREMSAESEQDSEASCR
jgi:hypothetical protein